MRVVKAVDGTTSDTWLRAALTYLEGTRLEPVFGDEGFGEAWDEG